MAQGQKTSRIGVDFFDEKQQQVWHMARWKSSLLYNYLILLNNSILCWGSQAHPSLRYFFRGAL